MNIMQIQSHLTQQPATPVPCVYRQRPRLAVLGLTLACSLFLAACGQQPAAVEPPPTTAPPTTAAPTEAPAALTPSPIAEAGDNAAVATDSATTDAATGLAELLPIAYVRDGVLYLETQSEGEENTARAIEDCAAGACTIAYTTWSPDASHLLYYVSSYESGAPRSLRVAAVDGSVQTITERAGFIQPAAWSPDGRAIVYREDTDTYAEATDGPARRIQELFTVTLDENGALDTPELRGEVSYGEGCGGGGRSESALAYEREGGFAYGYLSAVMHWTPDNILLYTDNCSTRGVSRFNLNTNTALDPYAGNLRSLSLNAAGDQWVAIDDQNQMVLGTPASLETTALPLEIQPEMVFFGKATGQIYVTSLEPTGDRDLFDLVATLDESIMLQPFVDTTIAKLFRIDPATGAATQIFGEDGYAYARVAELSTGDIVFSRVEDNAELVTALENGELNAENWRSFLPTVDVLWLDSASGTATPLLTNASQFTPGGAN